MSRFHHSILLICAFIFYRKQYPTDPADNQPLRYFPGKRLSTELLLLSPIIYQLFMPSRLVIRLPALPKAYSERRTTKNNDIIFLRFSPSHHTSQIQLFQLLLTQKRNPGENIQQKEYPAKRSVTQARMRLFAHQTQSPVHRVGSILSRWDVARFTQEEESTHKVNRQRHVYVFIIFGTYLFFTEHSLDFKDRIIRITTIEIVSEKSLHIRFTILTVTRISSFVNAVR